MDKITKEKFLSSNLPWVFDYNQKPAEEINPADSFNRLSNEKHTNKNHSNNCATVSQKAWKEAQPGQGVSERSALALLCALVAQHCPRGACVHRPSQTAF